MKKKRIITIIIIVLAVAAVGIVGFILFKNYNDQKARQKYNEAASSYANVTTGSNTDPTGALPKNPIDMAALYERNADIKGWIKVPGTNVDYPVLRNDENDVFYINHDLDGNYAFAGSIYMQQCNRANMEDNVTVLYGHNMADNSMFASLHSFENSSFFNEHKSFTIYIDGKKLEYEIISAFVYDDRHIMNSFNFTDPKSYQKFIDDVLNPHSVSVNIRKGATLTTDDKIVVLSTCLNSGDGRYLVVGKLTNTTDLQPML